MKRLVPSFVAAFMALAPCPAVGQQWLPDAVSVGIGAGRVLDNKIIQAACAETRPFALTAGARWWVLDYLSVGVSASRIAGSTHSGTCLAAPCPSTGACPRTEALGSDLLPISFVSALEPNDDSAATPRLHVAAGRFAGDGVNFLGVGGGIRVGRRTGVSVIGQFTHSIFNAPERVTDFRTGTELSASTSRAGMTFFELLLDWPIGN